MPWTRRYEDAEPQRVNRWLAQSGVCSRREAEDLIARGLVTVDGEPVSDPGRKILPGQTLVLADEAAADLRSAFTAVVHKPMGMVSAHPEPGQLSAADLLTREALEGPGDPPAPDASLPPLGRLDMESRGLLLLSADGVLAKAVIGPESKLDKEYRVRVTGQVTAEKLALLHHGLSLDGRALRPADVKLIAPQKLRMVLTEGRNRQIRRMCELVELRVVDLLRTRVGPLELGDLPEGKWRPLTADERQALITASRT